jgi:hypothetical protein
MPNFVKIRSTASQLLNARRQADMMKLTLELLRLLVANTPKECGRRQRMNNANKERTKRREN